jgi:glycosyltransferase involved in cell wall biosynthesis
MKISVVTVCFNAAETIAQTLESVARQEHPDVEHIVIDGASTDGTIDIVRCYSGGLAQVVSEADVGIYDAMNKGLARSSGDIVCFLNADDQYAHPQVLSRVAKQMHDFQLDALIGDVGFFSPKEPMRMVRRYRSNQFTPDRLAWGWMPAHPALFLSRAVVQRVGRFKTDYRIAGDYEFIVRVFHGREVRYRLLPEVLVHMQTGGVSTNGWRSRILLNREVIRACRENGLQTNSLKILSKYPAKILELLRR